MTVPSSALVTDQYQLTMLQGYYLKGYREVEACFDLFFRLPPFNSGYTIFAGVSEVLEFLESFRFSQEELDYLKKVGVFRDEFIEYLSGFRFTGEVHSMEEGSVVFPVEPLIRIIAPIDQCQIIETAILNTINFQTLIATKAARVCQEAGVDNVMEFGLRRAQGQDGGLSASRAAYIGGSASSSNVMAGFYYGIPISGTHAHSWVSAFDDELASFRAFAEIYPDNTVLLVDTYDTLNSGVPNAITVGLEMKEKGESLAGIRLDSGDLAYLSIEARKMLDAAGLTEVKIVASSDLDEYIIHDLNIQGAKIDIFGVGTRLATANGDPALTGVYKLSAVKKKGGEWSSRLKISEGKIKATLPGFKQVWRLFDDRGEMMGDIIEKEGVPLDFSTGIEGTHPVTNYERKLFDNIAVAKPMLSPVMKEGRRLSKSPSLVNIRKNVKESLSRLHPTMKRLLNPHIYKVSLGPELARETAKLRGIH